MNIFFFVFCVLFVSDSDRPGKDDRGHLGTDGGADGDLLVVRADGDIGGGVRDRVRNVTKTNAGEHVSSTSTRR